MKYYSDVTKKLYESEKALAEAEAKVIKEQSEAEEKAKKRGERAKEVEIAYKAVLDAQAHYNELKNKFIEDYGSFHMTVTDKAPISNLAEIFDYLINFN